MNAILYESNNTDSTPYIDDRKLKKLRKWLQYLEYIEGGGVGGKASDILESQIKVKRFLYENIQQY